MARAITTGLRARGVEVLNAEEDGTTRLSDSGLLSRASELGRVLFTRDEDLLAEGARRQRIGLDFNGIIYAHQLSVSIGVCVRDLEIIAKAGNPQDFLNRVEHLPL